MIFCALAGLFLDARPDVVARVEQGAFAVLVVLGAFIILAILVLLIYLRRSGTPAISVGGMSQRPGPGRPRKVYIQSQATPEEIQTQAFGK